jgi:hypothetical protein
VGEMQNSCHPSRYESRQPTLVVEFK